MQLQSDLAPQAQLIHAYSAASIQVNEKKLESSFLLTPEHLYPDWGPRSCQQLTMAHIEAVLQTRPDVVLLGTGTVLEWPEDALYDRVLASGAGIECMDTSAACRAFNIIAGEGRQVTAAFILPGDGLC